MNIITRKGKVYGEINGKETGGFDSADDLNHWAKSKEGKAFVKDASTPEAVEVPVEQEQEQQQEEQQEENTGGEGDDKTGEENAAQSEKTGADKSSPIQSKGKTEGAE